MMDIYYQLEQFTDLGDWVPVNEEGAPSTNGDSADTSMESYGLVWASARLGKQTGGKYRVVKVEVVHETTFGGETLCEDHLNFDNIRAEESE
jgi:hypothetical protein